MMGRQRNVSNNFSELPVYKRIGNNGKLSQKKSKMLKNTVSLTYYMFIRGEDMIVERI